MRRPSSPSLTVSATVPGKVMLAGEYTVLRGGETLAATVDLALTANLAATATPTVDGIVVQSDLWAERQLVPRAASPDDYPTEPLLAVVALGQRLYGVSGVTLDLRSQLAVSYGVGSSSALRLAVLAALADWARAERGLPPLTNGQCWDMAREALNLQRRAQQRASGYDIATQLTGGLVHFTAGANPPWPEACTQLAVAPTHLGELIHIFVGGAGAPTGPVVADTCRWLDQAPERWARLTSATTALIAALRASLTTATALPSLAPKVAAQRQSLAASPHFPVAVAQHLTVVPGEGESWSWKPTGAGGEDALLLLGSRAQVAPAAAVLHGLGWRPLPATFTMAGLTLSRCGERLVD